MSKSASFFIVASIYVVVSAGCAYDRHVKTHMSPHFEPNAIPEMRVSVVASSQTLVSMAFADMLTADMLGLGFRVIERNRLETILQEQKLSLSGMLENSQYEVIGKLANLDALFIFIAKHTGGAIDSCVVKLVDLKSGEILLATSYTRPSPKTTTARKKTMMGVSTTIVNSIRRRIRLEIDNFSE